jgi:hypothetical protein
VGLGSGGREGRTGVSCRSARKETEQTQRRGRSRCDIAVAFVRPYALPVARFLIAPSPPFFLTLGRHCTKGQKTDRHSRRYSLWLWRGVELPPTQFSGRLLNSLVHVYRRMLVCSGNCSGPVRCSSFFTAPLLDEVPNKRRVTREEAVSLAGSY